MVQRNTGIVFRSRQVRSVGSNVTSPESRFNKLIEPSTFQPSDLDNLILWVRADKGVTTILSGGREKVVTWQDQSSYQHILTQSVDGRRPWLGILDDGSPALHFDNIPGSAQFVGGPMPGINVGAGGTLSAFVVRHLKAFGAYGYIATAPTGQLFVNQGLMMYRETFSEIIRGASPAAQALYTESGSFSLTQPHIFFATHQTSMRSGTLDGDVNHYASSSFSNALLDQNEIIIGQLFQEIYPMSGAIAEVILYKDTLTADEILQVNTYLAGRYSITLCGSV